MSDQSESRQRATDGPDSPAPAAPAAAALPDAARDAQAPVHGRLDAVGMEGIAAPIVVAVAPGRTATALARIGAFVDLQRPEARGVHMSRLYLLLDEALAGPLTPTTLRNLLEEFLASHSGLSTQASLTIAFDCPLRRPALVSEHAGWRAYPVTLVGRLVSGRLQLDVGVDVTYASTCPSSAALARQLIQQAFDAEFPAQGALDRGRVSDWLGTERGIVATPHSQRSVASVRVRMDTTRDHFGIVDLIDLTEGALRTPVQTAVKRVDEQAFARLNGANLMFCEDAARRLRTALSNQASYLDFRVRVAHLESLHAHDAVAVATKGIPGGYTVDSVG